MFTHGIAGRIIRNPNQSEENVDKLFASLFVSSYCTHHHGRLEMSL